MQECDTLIIAGTSFPYIEFLPKAGQAKAVQIDIEPDSHRPPRPMWMSGWWGIAPAFSNSSPSSSPPIRTATSFSRNRSGACRSWNQLMEERGTRPDMPMKPQVVTYALSKMLDTDAIVISDSGTIATWAARYIEIRGDMQFSLSGIARHAWPMACLTASALRWPIRVARWCAWSATAV